MGVAGVVVLVGVAEAMWLGLAVGVIVGVSEAVAVAVEVGVRVAEGVMVAGSGDGGANVKVRVGLPAMGVGERGVGLGGTTVGVKVSIIPTMTNAVALAGTWVSVGVVWSLPLCTIAASVITPIPTSASTIITNKQTIKPQRGCAVV